MKILVASSKFQPEYSGSGLRAHNTYLRLREKFNIEYDVVCSSLEFRGNASYQIDGVNVTRITSFVKKGKNRTVRKIVEFINLVWDFYCCSKFIGKKRYDLVHTFGNSWVVTYFTLYAEKNGIPVVREICNDVSSPYYPGFIFTKIMKRIFKESNHNLIIAISNRLRTTCENHSVKNVWLKPNPVDTKKFSPVSYKEKIRLRNKFTKFSETDVVVSHLANFIPLKNHDFLLDVLIFLPDNYKLILAGPVRKEEQDYFDKVREKIYLLKLESRVLLRVGFLSNIQDYIRLSDVFLFPSKSEGLGTPILEAQASGVPVVSSTLKGITDVYIKDGKGGYESDLSASTFASKITQANKIDKKILLANSNEILKKYSDKVVDAEYFERFSNLIN